MHRRDSQIARNGCHQNAPPPLASAAPSPPATAEAAAGLIVLGRTTGGRVIRLPLPNRQKATVLAISTATVAAASMKWLRLLPPHCNTQGWTPVASKTPVMTATAVSLCRVATPYSRLSWVMSVVGCLISLPRGPLRTMSNRHRPPRCA